MLTSHGLVSFRYVYHSLRLTRVILLFHTVGTLSTMISDAAIATSPNLALQDQSLILVLRSCIRG